LHDRLHRAQFALPRLPGPPRPLHRADHVRHPAAVCPARHGRSLTARELQNPAAEAVALRAGKIPRPGHAGEVDVHCNARSGNDVLQRFRLSTSSTFSNEIAKFSSILRALVRVRSTLAAFPPTSNRMLSAVASDKRPPDCKAEQIRPLILL